LFRFSRFGVGQVGHGPVLIGGSALKLLGLASRAPRNELVRDCFCTLKRSLVKLQRSFDLDFFSLGKQERSLMLRKAMVVRRLFERKAAQGLGQIWCGLIRWGNLLRRYGRRIEL